MKIKFWENKTLKGNTNYTNELLRHIAIKNGHKQESKDFDILVVSLTSHYEIEELKRARKQHPDKKIIVGGHCSNAPASLLHWADYVNLGQGFEFFRDVNENNIETLPYIVSKEKKDGIFSQYIDWDKCPVVQIGKNSYSYLESVGCKNKCKFCLTSWLNKHQVNPKQATIKTLGKMYQKKQLYMIGNNYESISCNLNVSDVTIKGYNERYSNYENIKLLRVGLESVSEQTRKALGKNISDEDVKEFFQRTKQEKKRCNVFLIAGLDPQETWENFIQVLPKCQIESSPRIGIIINYFDPSMGTPLWSYDLTKIIPINLPKIKRIWKLHNARIVIFRDLTLSWKNSTFDSLLQRCKTKDVESIMELRKVKYSDINAMFESIKKAGYEDILTGNFQPEYELKNWCKLPKNPN